MPLIKALSPGSCLEGMMVPRTGTTTISFTAVYNGCLSFVWQFFLNDAEREGFEPPERTRF